MTHIASDADRQIDQDSMRRVCRECRQRRLDNRKPGGRAVGGFGGFEQRQRLPGRGSTSTLAAVALRLQAAVAQERCRLTADQAWRQGLDGAPKGVRRQRHDGIRRKQHLKSERLAGQHEIHEALQAVAFPIHVAGQVALAPLLGTLLRDERPGTLQQDVARGRQIGGLGSNGTEKLCKR